MIGYDSIGLEIMDDAPHVNALFIPVGGQREKASNFI
jgi:threonine dehydratase